MKKILLVAIFVGLAVMSSVQVLAQIASCGCSCGKVLPPPCSDDACKRACSSTIPLSSGSSSDPAAGRADSSSLDRDLLNAAFNGDTAKIQDLLDKGANIEARSRDGSTALIAAAGNGKAEAVKLLLDKCASIEARDNDGETALFSAARYAKPEVVKLLLDNGANIETKNNSSFGALNFPDYNRKEEERHLRECPNDPDYLCGGVPTSTRKQNLANDTQVVQLLQQAQQRGFPRGSARQCAADLAADFGQALSELRLDPSNDVKRKKVVELAAGLSTLPPIPEQARQPFLQASALIKQSSSPQQLREPINLLRTAVLFAPWWGNAYYNLSRALELSGEYDEALKQLNYYLELKPSEAEARDARDKFSVIQKEKEASAQKTQQNESMLAVKYVSGGATRLRWADAPAWWKPEGRYGVMTLYTYWLPEEDPFQANVFRMPNGRILVIMLNAQTNNGAYSGDQIAVWDETEKSCHQGWSRFMFGAQDSFDACGFHYGVIVTNPPNATVTVKYPATGASVTVPLALLYRGRALRASGLVADKAGEVYQGGVDVKILHFDVSVVNAALDPNVNAMGLTPTSVTLYQEKK